jgi:hypothetical protein
MGDQPGSWQNHELLAGFPSSVIVQLYQSFEVGIQSLKLHRYMPMRFQKPFGLLLMAF